MRSTRSGRIHAAGGGTPAGTRQDRRAAAGKRLRRKDPSSGSAHRRQEGRHQSRHAAAAERSQHRQDFRQGRSTAPSCRQRSTSARLKSVAKVVIGSRGGGALPEAYTRGSTAAFPQWRHVSPHLTVLYCQERPCTGCFYA